MISPYGACWSFFSEFPIRAGAKESVIRCPPCWRPWCVPRCVVFEIFSRSCSGSSFTTRRCGTCWDFATSLRCGRRMPTCSPNWTLSCSKRSCWSLSRSANCRVSRPHPRPHDGALHAASRVACDRLRRADGLRDLGWQDVAWNSEGGTPSRTSLGPNATVSNPNRNVPFLTSPENSGSTALPTRHPCPRSSSLNLCAQQRGW